MSVRKKMSDGEIKRRLIADANDPSAWEAPVTVSPSRAPRPAWYGRTRHLELAARFHVLSVLHRLGAEANLTYAQPDNVDITAVRQSGEAFTIDVKTLAGTTQWAVEPFRARKHHFMVFVCFNQEWRSDPQLVPETFIWSSERLKAFISREKAATVSLQAVATKLDPNVAWDQLTSQPAA
jgi:hypothetical protein